MVGVFWSVDFLFYFEVKSSCVLLSLCVSNVLTSVSLALPCSQCLVFSSLYQSLCCSLTLHQLICLTFLHPFCQCPQCFFVLYLAFVFLSACFCFVVFCHLLIGLQIYSSSLYVFLRVCLECFAFGSHFYNNSQAVMIHPYVIAQ